MVDYLDNLYDVFPRIKQMMEWLSLDDEEGTEKWLDGRDAASLAEEAVRTQEFIRQIVACLPGADKEEIADMVADLVLSIRLTAKIHQRLIKWAGDR